MPIHDQGYRRYTGRRIPPGRGWWVIARAGVLERVRERRFLALMLLAWSPFIVRALQIYASTSFAQLSFLAPGPDTFREFLDQQSPFLFFITIYAGSGLIASDRRANALQVYLSKPLTRVQYVLGKLLALAVFLLAASWLPAMALLALQMIFAGSSDFIRDNPSLVPAITLFCVIEVLATSLAMLALSSLSTSRRFVAVMYAGAVVFAAAVYQVLRGITGTTRVGVGLAGRRVRRAGDRHLPRAGESAALGARRRSPPLRSWPRCRSSSSTAGCAPWTRSTLSRSIDDR